ncbi:MAG TPA: hypothetical protein VK783_00100 [Bacteroidia bacterium]|nr:hypothetical protein [Bacteroidia bacterium]
MTNKKQELQGLKGEKVTIYTVENQFTGILDETGTEFLISNGSDFLKLKPEQVINIKSLCSSANIIFVYNHFPF